MAIATIASSANAASVSGSAAARVVTPIAISQNKGLEFGSFAPSSTSLGTINQAAGVTGGVTAVSGGATRSAGIFNVTGEAISGTPYTFTLPAIATLTSGANNSMTANLSLASGAAPRILNGGTDLVTVNGVLNVAMNQAAGTYAGTYTVTVNY